MRGDWRRNLGLKGLALGFALLLWLYVHGAKVVERELLLPLRISGLPDSLVLVAAPPQKARVLVSGPAQELLFRRFWPGSELRIDASSARPPSFRSAPGAPEVMLGSAEHLTVLRVLEPSVLDLAIDRRVERMLPVRVVALGELETGYALAAPLRADPPRVLCRGPASLLDAQADIPTRPIELRDRRQAFLVRAALDPGPQPIAVHPAEVSVSGNVSRVVRRELADRPVTLLVPPGDGVTIDVRPARATVILSGPSEAIAALDPNDVRLVLDVGDLGPGEHGPLRIAAVVPGWAQIDRLDPAAVDIVVRRQRPRR